MQEAQNKLQNIHLHMYSNDAPPRFYATLMYSNTMS